MPSVLHLLKADSVPNALVTIKHQSRDPRTNVTVVLMQGMAAPALPHGVTVHRLAGNGSEGSLTYGDLLDLIFSADQVISW